MPSLISRVFSRRSRNNRRQDVGCSILTEFPEEVQIRHKHGELSIRITNHEEVRKHTQYHVECSITWPAEDAIYSVHTWALELRLRHFRKYLHDVVKRELGSSYNKLFKGAHFARHGGLSGTTSRLNRWLGRLARNLNLRLLPPVLNEAVYTYLGAPEPPMHDIPVSVEQPVSPVSMLVGHCRSSDLHGESVDESNSIQMSTQGESSITSSRAEDDDDSSDGTWSNLGLSDTDSLEDACESEETDAGTWVGSASCAVPWIADDELPVVDLGRCHDGAFEKRGDPIHPSATCDHAKASGNSVECPSGVSVQPCYKPQVLDCSGEAATASLGSDIHESSKYERNWGVRLRQSLPKSTEACDGRDELQIPVRFSVVSSSEAAENLPEHQTELHVAEQSNLETTDRTGAASKFLEKLRARKEIVDMQKISGRGMLF